MNLEIGQELLLSKTPVTMSDSDFERLLIGKSQNTTIPYMRRAKEFIIRDLLTIGKDRRSITKDTEIISGTYQDRDGHVEGRVFVVKDGEKVILKWRGACKNHGENYRKIRDELAGVVPYRTYGRAAALGKGHPADLHSINTIGDKIDRRTVDNTLEPRSISLNISEKGFEDILAKYPELIEEGLFFEGRQRNVGGKAIDLLFKDKHGEYLIVEMKKGTIKREHIAQLFDYEGYFVNEFKPGVRVMLVGNYVPHNFKNSLDHHGIEYRAFTLDTLREFLLSKNDVDLLKALSWI